VIQSDKHGAEQSDQKSDEQRYCLRKFIAKNKNYELCLAPAKVIITSSGTLILLCNECTLDKNFACKGYKRMQDNAYATNDPAGMLNRQVCLRIRFTDTFMQRFDEGHRCYEDNISSSYDKKQIRFLTISVRK